MNQLTADEARQIAKGRTLPNDTLNMLYRGIRRAARKGHNTIDVCGLNEERAECAALELRNQGFHVVVLPWKMLIRWL